MINFDKLLKNIFNNLILSNNNSFNNSLVDV